jgi:hypothetical protein
MSTGRASKASGFSRPRRNDACSDSSSFPHASSGNPEVSDELICPWLLRREDTVEFSNVRITYAKNVYFHKQVNPRGLSFHRSYSSIVRPILNLPLFLMTDSLQAFSVPWMASAKPAGDADLQDGVHRMQSILSSNGARKDLSHSRKSIAYQNANVQRGRREKARL